MTTSELAQIKFRAQAARLQYFMSYGLRHHLTEDQALTLARRMEELMQAGCAIGVRELQAAVYLAQQQEAA